VSPPTSVDVPENWRFEDEHRDDGLVPHAAEADITDVWQISAAPDVSPTPEGEPEVAPPTADVVRGQFPASASEVSEVTYSDLSGVEPEKLVIGSRADPGLAQQYNRLAATLHHAQLESNVHTLMVTSAMENEGKTLTSTNLALTLSRSYERRVLLVDADLRRPSVHALLRLSNQVGLGDVLKRPGTAGRLPVRQILPSLWVMTAGPANPDPIAALVSDTMRQFLVDAAEQFDWVIVDTPPVASLPDGNLLASMIDTALLVINAGVTPYSLVSRAVEAIGRSRILGVALNRADQPDGVDEGYYRYAYGQSKPEPSSRWFRFGSARKG
jgi:protein-tyrosine kinase